MAVDNPDDPDYERNPVLRRMLKTKNLSNSHHRSKRQESSLAKRLGAQKVAASGAREVKGDIRKKGILRLEAKTTKNKSFSVTLEMVRAIEAAAMSGGETPAMVIEFNDGFGKVLGEVAIVPMYVLEELCGE